MTVLHRAPLPRHPIHRQSAATVTRRLIPSSHCLIWSRTVPHRLAPHHQTGNCQRRSAPDHARFLQLSETPPPSARCHSEGFPTGRVSVCKTPVSTTLGLGCGRPVTAHAAA